MTLKNRVRHRINAASAVDLLPDRVIGQCDRVQLGGGWRGFYELDAVQVRLQAVPEVGARLKWSPEVAAVVGAK